MPPRVNTLGVIETWANTPYTRTHKNGLQVWTCRPPRNLKVYKSNNVNAIVTRGRSAA